MGDRDRLDSTDAQFVDIIHTAGHWVGSQIATGHIDFYPNKGAAPQPGCEGSESLDLSCSHFQAWKLYLLSVDRIADRSLPPMLGIKCASHGAFMAGQCCNQDSEFAELGEVVDSRARGIFYLSTGPPPDRVLPVNIATNCKLASDHLPGLLH